MVLGWVLNVLIWLAPVFQLSRVGNWELVQRKGPADQRRLPRPGSWPGKSVACCRLHGSYRADTKCYVTVLYITPPGVIEREITSIVSGGQK